MEPAPLPPPCPKCGETSDISYTLRSEFGNYCRCAACGYVWHSDATQLEASASRERVPKREDG